MKFDADVARILKNPILRWPVDDWLSGVDLTAHTKVHLHLGEDLNGQVEMRLITQLSCL